MKSVPKGPSNNFPVLVQIMAWYRPGNKPLSAPMMVSLLMSPGLDELTSELEFTFWQTLKFAYTDIQYKDLSTV